MPGSVVVLGLLASVSWGLGDFGGGFVSRRAPVAGVLLVSQLAGAAISALLAVALAERLPGTADLAWALASSGLGGVGLACLYIGLARGRMSVVAPVTGVLVAAIPAVAGILLQGLPPLAVVAGLALAIVSVVVVSRVGDPGSGRPSGLRWGLTAGVALGGVTLTLSRFAPGLVFGPVALMRLAEGVLFGLAIAVVGDRSGPRFAWRLPRPIWPAVLAVAACDTLGTAFYVAATQAGRPPSPASSRRSTR